jgi:hypothetical protein
MALLGLPGDDLDALDRRWGTTFSPGHRTLPAEVLFPRIETTA